MSLNLHCNEVELWQTPTYITLMTYSNNDGGWLGIKYRYIQWVESHLDGVWQNREDLNHMMTTIKLHVKELNRHRKLTFSIG
jgi:hypothetical protein